MFTSLSLRENDKSCGGVCEFSFNFRERKMELGHRGNASQLQFFTITILISYRRFLREAGQTDIFCPTKIIGSSVGQHGQPVYFD